VITPEEGVTVKGEMETKPSKEAPTIPKRKVEVESRYQFEINIIKGETPYVTPTELAAILKARDRLDALKKPKASLFNRFKEQGGTHAEYFGTNKRTGGMRAWADGVVKVRKNNPDVISEAPIFSKCVETFIKLKRKFKGRIKGSLDNYIQDYFKYMEKFKPSSKIKKPLSFENYIREIEGLVIKKVPTKPKKRLPPTRKLMTRESFDALPLEQRRAIFEPFGRAYDLDLKTFTRLMGEYLSVQARGVRTVRGATYKTFAQYLKLQKITKRKVPLKAPAPKVPETATARVKWRAKIEKETKAIIETHPAQTLRDTAKNRRKTATKWEEEVAQMKDSIKGDRGKRMKDETPRRYEKLLDQIKQKEADIALYKKTATMMEEAAAKEVVLRPEVTKVSEVTAVEKPKAERRAVREEAEVISLDEARKVREAEAHATMMGVLTAEAEKVAAVGGGVPVPRPAARHATAVGHKGRVKPVTEPAVEAPKVEPKQVYEESAATITRERDALKGIDSGFQDLYETAGRRAVKNKYGFDPKTVEGRKFIDQLKFNKDYLRLEDINKEYLAAARKAINKKLKIRPEEFVISQNIYEVIIGGKLRSNVENFLGPNVKIDGPITIRQMKGGSEAAHILQFKTTTGKKMTVFMKPLSGDVEVLMMHALRDGGVDVPKYSALKYKTSTGEPREFMLSLDVRHMEGVEAGVSFRTLERPEYRGIFDQMISDIALGEQSQFANSLGFQSHMSYVVGLQDLNPKNLFIIVKSQKGKPVLSTSRIDMDVGFCYPTEKGKAPLVYASYLKAHLKSLQSAAMMHTGKPLSKAQVEGFLRGFMKGVQDAAKKAKDSTFRSSVMRRIDRNKDIAIGLGGNRVEIKLGATTTYNEINRGQMRQLLILDDPNNLGRIPLDSKKVTNIFDEMANLGEKEALDLWHEIIQSMPITRDYAFVLF
jgi:hypothetical protein